jgi:UDP-N-acetyl-D-galactosamine dehydrogenase
VLVMGFTFKENCPDLRNTRVVDVMKELQEFGCQVDVTDCWADNAEAEREYGISLTEQPGQGEYDGVIVAVPHNEYAAMRAGDLRGYLKEGRVLYDLKGLLPLGEADLRL